MDFLDVALTVAGALDRAGVAYFVGGSMASSFQGEPRATNDIDLVIDLQLGQVEPFAEALGADFEIDRQALEEAVRRRGSWNIFFLPLFTKIDLFILGGSPFDRSEFERRAPWRVRGERTLFIKSPEDSVLRKLLWYRSGGESSERQWRDVLEILRVTGADLDHAYLDGWARPLAVMDLLERARLTAR